MKKILPVHDLTVRPLSSEDTLPTDLLLLADPSPEQVEKYIHEAHVLLAFAGENAIAVCVLLPQGSGGGEIKNLAVDPGYQGRGVGRWLLNEVCKYAAIQNVKTLTIATGNSSIGQLYLYQSAGFEITAIEKDYFVMNYPNPIFESGIQCKHKIILQKTFP